MHCCHSSALHALRLSHAGICSGAVTVGAVGLNLVHSRLSALTPRRSVPLHMRTLASSTRPRRSSGVDQDGDELPDDSHDPDLQHAASFTPGRYSGRTSREVSDAFHQLQTIDDQREEKARIMLPSRPVDALLESSHMESLKKQLPTRSMSLFSLGSSLRASQSDDDALKNQCVNYLKTGGSLIEISIASQVVPINEAVQLMRDSTVYRTQPPVFLLPVTLRDLVRFQETKRTRLAQLHIQPLDDLPLTHSTPAQSDTPASVYSASGSDVQFRVTDSGVTLAASSSKQFLNQTKASTDLQERVKSTESQEGLAHLTPTVPLPQNPLSTDELNTLFSDEQKLQSLIEAYVTQLLRDTRLQKIDVLMLHGAVDELFDSHSNHLQTLLSVCANLSRVKLIGVRSDDWSRSKLDLCLHASKRSEEQVLRFIQFPFNLFDHSVLDCDTDNQTLLQYAKSRGVLTLADSIEESFDSQGNEVRFDSVDASAVGSDPHLFARKLDHAFKQCLFHELRYFELQKQAREETRQKMLDRLDEADDESDESDSAAKAAQAADELTFPARDDICLAHLIRSTPQDELYDLLRFESFVHWHALPSLLCSYRLLSVHSSFIDFVRHLRVHHAHLIRLLGQAIAYTTHHTLVKPIDEFIQHKLECECTNMSTHSTSTSTSFNSLQNKRIALIMAAADGHITSFMTQQMDKQVQKALQIWNRTDKRIDLTHCNPMHNILTTTQARQIIRECRRWFRGKVAHANEAVNT